MQRLKNAIADRYVIERELGHGGMATVYLARDLRHNRQVAVKVLRPELTVAVGAERFLREIEIAARLTHPHILPLHDSGEADGFLYYVMPYVEGDSLRNKLAREGELPIPEAIRILRDVVDALAFAHQHGVVHRDIKADNVLVLDRHAMVTDFGVAKALNEATGRGALTSVGVALGTPAYMAPEQASADPNTDHRADIYAVGAMAYEMLTGRTLFTATTPQAMLAAHVSDTPEPVTNHRGTVPPALAELVMRCLEKKPADRWQTAAELLSRLEALTTPGSGTVPTAAFRAEPRAKTARRVLAGVTVVGALLLAAVLWPRGERGPVPDVNAIAVLPFRLSSADTSLAWLREGIMDLLAAKLTGEGGPRAADPRTVMAAWRRAVGSHYGELAEEASIDLAQGIGAGRVMLGTIVSTPTPSFFSPGWGPGTRSQRPGPRSWRAGSESFRWRPTAPRRGTRWGTCFSTRVRFSNWTRPSRERWKRSVPPWRWTRRSARCSIICWITLLPPVTRRCWSAWATNGFRSRKESTSPGSGTPP